MTHNNSEKFDNFLFNFALSNPEVSPIFDEIKLAILNKDTEKIENICSLVKKHTQNTNMKNIVNEACDSLYQEVICTSAIIKRTQRTEEKPTLEENILILNKGIGSCKHAIIYVDSDFEDFEEDEIDYLNNQLGIQQIEIIDSSNDEKIYSGSLLEESENKNSNFNEGWLILFGIIILIGIGFFVTKRK